MYPMRSAAVETCCSDPNHPSPNPGSDDLRRVAGVKLSPKKRSNTYYKIHQEVNVQDG